MSGNFNSKHTGQTIDDTIDETILSGNSHADRLIKQAMLNLTGNRGVPEADKVVTTDSNNRVPGLAVLVVDSVEPAVKVTGMIWADTS
jgi:hypothetical protein